MNFLEEKIMADGVVKAGDILKVDNFLNHQIDINVIRQIAHELKRRFEGERIDKVVTIEASGITIATLLGDLCGVDACPWCLPRKARRPTAPTTSMCLRLTRSPTSG